MVYTRCSIYGCRRSVVFIDQPDPRCPAHADAGPDVRRWPPYNPADYGGPDYQNEYQRRLGLAPGEGRGIR